VSEYANEDFLWQCSQTNATPNDDARGRQFSLAQSFASNQNTAQLFQLTQAFVSSAQDLLYKIAWLGFPSPAGEPFISASSIRFIKWSSRNAA
jgi:hypothetical protein